MDIDLSPPEGVRSALRRGLELHEEGHSGDGLQSETVAWARKMASGTAASVDKIKKMNAWHARHAVDKKPGWESPPTPGYVAFLLWGGAAGRSWAKSKVEEIERKEKLSSNYMPLSYFGDVDVDSVEGQVDILNRLHADEIRAAMQYANHEVAFKGPNCLSVQAMFAEHYEEELKHAEKLRKLIDWLGGNIENGLEMMATIGPGAPRGLGDVLVSNNNTTMLQQDLVGEQGAIEAYTEAISIFQNRNYMVALTLTEILRDEWEHQRELRDLLNIN